MSEVLVAAASVLVGGSAVFAAMRRAEARRWRRLRDGVVMHRGYRPDEYVGRPEGETFGRASDYWVGMVGRMMDDVGPRAARADQPRSSS